MTTFEFAHVCSHLFFPNISVNTHDQAPKQYMNIDYCLHWSLLSLPKEIKGKIFTMR